jgi:hypothetical protein
VPDAQIDHKGLTGEGCGTLESVEADRPLQKACRLLGPPPCSPRGFDLYLGHLFPSVSRIQALSL